MSEHNCHNQKNCGYCQGDGSAAGGSDTGGDYRGGEGGYYPYQPEKKPDLIIKVQTPEQVDAKVLEYLKRAKKITKDYSCYDEDAVTEERAFRLATLSLEIAKMIQREELK